MSNDFNVMDERQLKLSGLRQLQLGDIQHGSFLSQAQRLDLERSIFEPLRFLSTFGGDVPDRLTPRPFMNAPAVTPGQTFVNEMAMKMPGYAATSNFPAYLASGFSGGYDPSDIDPVTGKPVFHQPSLFKTMQSPTRFLSPETVSPQMAIPFNASGMAFDTKRAMFSPYQVSPSSAMVDLYHRQASQPQESNSREQLMERLNQLLALKALAMKPLTMQDGEYNKPNSYVENKAQINQSSGYPLSRMNSGLSPYDLGSQILRGTKSGVSPATFGETGVEWSI